MKCTPRLSALLALLVSAGSLAAEPLPQVDKDGLQLRPSPEGAVVYVRPGAKFDQYRRVAILDCYVEFAKNWERDYNADHPGHRITSADTDRIKSELSAQFKKVFTQELEKNGGYQVVDGAAPDVLILRPAILNLKITAPDLMSPGMGATVVSSAGQMTLYLELWDSTTNTILARVVAAESGVFAGRTQAANRVTNMGAADDVLRAWADALRKRFDAVHAVPASH